MVGIVLISIVVIALLMGAMAIGVILQKKSLRGSCGGSEVFDCDGDAITCGACPNRDQQRRRHAAGGAFREFVNPGR